MTSTRSASEGRPAFDPTTAVAQQLVLQRLESLARAGVKQIPKLPAVALSASQPPLSPQEVRSATEPEPPAVMEAPMPRTKSPPTPRTTASPAVTSTSAQLNQPYPLPQADSAADRQLLLDALNAEVRGCTASRDLACSRKQTVFGVGHATPRVVFFGEAPGADEDRLGEPFVGRAGQLLTKIIEACGWQRSDVYIMNVLKCRPPENRNPLPPEVVNCRRFFERQFEILQPEYIVCAGTVPAQALLETTESVGKLRGRFHTYRGSKVLVTYHPSYLLRNPSAKKYVWEDMQMLLREMGLPVPGKG